MAGRSFKVNMAADGGVAGISTRSLSNNCCSFNGAASPVVTDAQTLAVTAPSADLGLNA